MKEAIVCKYSCEPCGIRRRSVSVPSRGDEEVTEWMDKVCIPALIRDHAAQSPTCRAGEFKELMIPLGNKEGTMEASKIGGVPDTPKAIQ